MEFFVALFNSKYMITFSGIVTLIIAFFTLYDKFLMVPTLKIDYLKGVLYKDGLLFLNFKIINPTLRTIDFYNLDLKINNNFFEAEIPKKGVSFPDTSPNSLDFLISKNKIYRNHGHLTRIVDTTISLGSSIELNLLYDIRPLKEIAVDRVELFLSSSLKRKRVKLNAKYFKIE